MRGSSVAVGRGSRYTSVQRGQRTARKLSVLVRYSKSSPTPMGSPSVPPQMQHAADSISSAEASSGSSSTVITRDPTNARGDLYLGHTDQCDKCEERCGAQSSSYSAIWMASRFSHVTGLVGSTRKLY